MNKEEMKAELKRRIKCQDSFIEYLDKYKYFECPAAILYHSNYKGGLFAHSKAVAESLVYLTDKLNLSWERDESPYVIGYLHDLCKCDDYIFGEVDDKFIISKNERRKPGHGHKSLDMIMGHYFLTPEEKICIRYHMGAFTDKSEWNDFNAEVKDNINVLWTHTADMIASQVKGV